MQIEQLFAIMAIKRSNLLGTLVGCFPALASMSWMKSNRKLQSNGNLLSYIGMLDFFALNDAPGIIRKLQ